MAEQQNSPDLSLPNNVGSSDVHFPESSTTEAFMRFLIGNSIESLKYLQVRLAEAEAQTLLSVRTAEGRDQETEYERLRFALIGLLFVSRRNTTQGLSTLLSSTRKTARTLDDAVYQLFRNPLTGPFVRPFKVLTDAIVWQVEDEVHRWVRIGRLEEKQGRAISKVIASQLLEEFIELLSENPELGELVQQQSIGLAGEMVDAMRQMAFNADALVDGLLRRRAPTQRSAETNMALPPTHGNPPDKRTS